MKVNCLVAVGIVIAGFGVQLESANKPDYKQWPRLVCFEFYPVNDNQARGIAYLTTISRRNPKGYNSQKYFECNGAGRRLLDMSHVQSLNVRDCITRLAIHQKWRVDNALKIRVIKKIEKPKPSSRCKKIMETCAIL